MNNKKTLQEFVKFMIENAERYNATTMIIGYDGIDNWDLEIKIKKRKAVKNEHRSTTKNPKR